ncbi:hypothetical protein AK88_00828 [Plasmodium fragile]|uniref:Schizont-infected cell agglutination C-terminal domain-containing protein n=1 Tax=Plasmodium fragile TaxID=5857 RepID=A0A0D9QS71_PLAFR|nr:uncharacterized protein AK88_00828 [Plasmodium fragile]KJP89617.1 hypothetical protein AK88_00828 [Plasmodium fragile]
MAQRLKNALVKWAQDRRIWKMEQFDTKLWQDMETVLNEFVDYMQREGPNLHMYAVSCGDAGWKRRGEAHKGRVYTDHSVGDVMKCTLMLGALFFVTGWGNEMNADTGASANDTAMKAIMRCMVADVFANILAEIKCRYEWTGIDRAWDVMESMGGKGGVENPISSGTCTLDAYKDTQVGTADLTGAVRRWLQKNPDIRGRMDAIEKNPKCNILWSKYKTRMEQSEHDALPTTTGNVHQEDGVIGSGGIANAIVTVVRDVFEEMKGEITETSTSPPDIPGAGGAKPVATPPATTTPVAAGEGTSGTGVAPGRDPVGRADPTAGGQDGVATVSGQQPQPPAPPTEAKPAETVAGTADAAPPGPHERAELGTGGREQSPPQEEENVTPKDDKGEEKCPYDKNNAVSVLSDPRGGSRAIVSAGTHFYPGQPDCTTWTLLKEQEKATSSTGTCHSPMRSTGNSSSGDKDATGGTTTSGSSATTHPAAAAPAAPADGTIQGTVAEVTPKNKGDDPRSAPSPGDHVVDGGNDDPPPLNPPKPKPNPNPDQSGSTGTSGDAPIPGSAPSAGTEEGAGGQTGAGPGGGGGSSSSGTEQGTVGSTTTTDTQTPSTTVTPTSPQSPLAPSTPKGGDGAVSHFVPPPSKPFDTKDLIPYTPAIIPAVVGIGIVAFFLWKYFAHLAKRRRTYRTVRDVPSPPLDEDILEHLQRAELPPPDYGYTMVTPPASTSGRGGSPRVHKRTIIELHLEVLNECEAAAWENVKDDYWKIVVQAFANELMRDAKGYSSSLDAPITNQDLSGNNVSSTDSAETDPCPPHDPDPCSCMETAPLDTDPSPPNDDDPDPWSCMETIQLATDRSPPTADDPWSCMETMQFETDPCPPNADDPDPCSCMEHIDLDAQHNAHSDHGDATSECTQWINWIDRHKHLLQACTTQPWFLQLTADWKQYLRTHMAATDDNGNREFGQHGNGSSTQMKKDAWKKWVAKQHRQMSMYGPEEWFQHLLNTVQEETASHKREVPAVDTDLEVDKHTDDVETQEEHVAKVQIHNRVARSLAKIKAIASEEELELDPMAFEHYEGAYDDVDEPYAESYAFSPKRICSDAQWEEEEDGTILKERKVVEYEVPQQVHYERKWKIQHDAREEEVDSNETLSADVAVAEAVATSSTSLSKVDAQGSLPPSVQNKGQGAKTQQAPKGSSGTGTTASTGIRASTMNVRQAQAIKMKTGRDFSRRKLATYIIYRWNGYTQYVLTWDIPELLPPAKAKVPKKNILTDKISSKEDQKPQLPEKAETPKKQEKPERPEAPKKTGESEKQDTRTQAEECEKSNTPKNPEAPEKKEAAEKPEASKKAGESEKP